MILNNLPNNNSTIKFGYKRLLSFINECKESNIILWNKIDKTNPEERYSAIVYKGKEYKLEIDRNLNTNEYIICQN